MVRVPFRLTTGGRSGDVELSRLMWRPLAFVLAVATAAPAFGEAYQAVCEPMRTGPPKKPHAEWRGPCRFKRDAAKRDADEHNRQFRDHDARVVVVIDGCGDGDPLSPLAPK